MSQWLWLGLAAYSCGGSRGFGTLLRTAFPVRSLKRETVECEQLRRGALPLSNAIKADGLHRVAGQL